MTQTQPAVYGRIRGILNIHHGDNMQTDILYAFQSDTDATRFLNELKPWTVAPVRARLNSGNKVLVSYEFDGKGFDTIPAKLDDLAARYHGHEISF